MAPAKSHVRAIVAVAATTVCVAAGVGAVAIALSGGFTLRIGGVRLSARRAWNPLMVALAAGVMAWAVATLDQRRAATRTVLKGGFLRQLVASPERTARGVAAAAVATVLVFGFARGSFHVAGSDSYGYVSQAQLWVAGDLVVRQPFAREMIWPGADQALAPLAFRPQHPAPHGTDIVPVYPPGLPMLMALFSRVAGPTAVFWVVPLLGGVAIWACYALGRHMAGPIAGAGAAVLLATSPPFLAELLQPTSDVPATALWTTALALTLFDRRASVIGAGLAAGLAVLIRPNLVPLAAVLAALLLLPAFQARRLQELAVKTALFAAGFVPACLVLAAFNWSLYGSPLRTGYGPVGNFYAWSHLSANLAIYLTRLAETQTPIVALVVAAPFLLARTAASTAALSPRGVSVGWLVFIAVLGLSYAFYMPYDEPLRFLMPAYPPMFALTTATVVTLLTRWIRKPNYATAAIALVFGLTASWSASSALANGLIGSSTAERRHVTAAEYVRDRLPERAVILSWEHSGTVRHYANRLTVRYEWIPPTHLDFVVEELRRLGYYPYFLLDSAERVRFRTRFQEHSRLGAVDWLPVALLHDDQVRLYDPADRVDGRPDRPRVPDVVAR